MLEKAVKKGFDVDKASHQVSVMYLLEEMLQAQTIEFDEYLRKYGLANDFRDDMRTLNRNFNVFGKKVRKLINTQDGAMNMFDDYDKLKAMIDKFIKTDE